MKSTVLLLHRDLPYHGGVANSYLTFGQYCDRSLFNVVFGTFRPASHEFSLTLEGLDIPLITLTEPYPKAIANLRTAIRTLNINVIVCGSFKSYITAKAASVATPCHVIYRVPSIPIQNDPYRKILFRLLARRGSLVFISHAVLAAHSYAWHRGPTSIVYNGVADLDSSKPTDEEFNQLRNELGIDTDSLIVGYIAEFTEWKDHPTLIRAFNELWGKYPNLHLLLIGTGHTIADNKVLAGSLPSVENIHFLGARTDARRLVYLMNVYAHPSDGEAFGRAVAEAMLAHRPIVAARAGALPELIRHKETGLLFEAHCPSQLASAIDELLENTQLAESLGRSARDYALMHFTPEKFAEGMTLAILERLAVLNDSRRETL